MPQPWPWVKVIERSSSTYVDAAADAVADAAETNWKHKVTPDRGDLMTSALHKIYAKAVPIKETLKTPFLT